ncbi:MAG: SAM-dependent methyltransferase [Verrucomicrobiota bacterium]
MPRELRGFLPALLLLFVGSGCAALIYEIVWLQLLQLVIGLTTVSLGVLLGTYMGGMCLGSFLLARVVSARRHPLRVYAALELGIGVIGIAVLFGMPWVSQIYTATGGAGFGGIMVRAAVAAVCLLPPTLLMGATLPAISRWVESSRQGVSWLGLFYAGNISGAVFGCLLAGFYLLRLHDMATATFVAAGINGTVALIAWVLSLWTSFTPQKEDAKTQIQPEAGGRAAIYIAIALSGVGALGAEVVWTRLLALMFGGTVYTFSIILAVFLVGLGLGSGIGSFLTRLIKQPRLALGVCQLLLILAAAWTALIITRSLPYWPVNPALLDYKLARSPWLLFQLDMARCLWAILPGPILWGASFPLALAALASRGQDPGRLVGGVYAANTVGAIVGALGFSLLVVPHWGTVGAQRLLILLPIFSGLVVLAPMLWRGVQEDAESEKTPLGWTGAVELVGALTLALALGCFLAWKTGPLPWEVVAYGRFSATYENLRPGIVDRASVPVGTTPVTNYCVYMGEGLNGSVAVTLQTDGVLSFHSAGKIQASNDPRDMRLQRLLGHISALAFPEPKSVLVVACGAGVTAGSFVPYPSVKRIVICDIEPLVPDHVAPMFDKENYGVVKDPRVEVVHDDGRHFIRTTKEKFDVITSDPIDPWVKGCAALNTVEYYQMCKDHLNPGGVMSLWIPFYESNRETIKSVLATFFKVFPNGIVWSNDSDGTGYDAVLFGQVDPTRIDVGEWQARLERPDYAAVRDSLADAGFNTAVDLLATYAIRASDLRGWMADAQINTDGNMRLQYLAGMACNTYDQNKILSEITSYYLYPDNLFVGGQAWTDLMQSRLKLREGK